MWKTLIFLVAVFNVQAALSSEPLPPPPSPPTPPGASIDGELFLFFTAIVIGFFLTKKYSSLQKGSL